MTKGTVFNIMRYCVHDGPGIRTTVFFKGCPLRCEWCHNPESQSFRPQLMFSESRCIGCMDCAAVCPRGAISRREDGMLNDAGKCTDCGACADACPAAAREMVGRPYTPEVLFREIKKDKVFFTQSGGGVTFSGGEPLSQPDFLMESLKLCAGNGIHTAVDTCGCTSWELLREAIAYTGLFIYDIKLMDSAAHERYTRRDNEQILDNLLRLARSGCRIWIRLPIIPGINDTPEHLYAAGELIKDIGGAEQVRLLPFHNISREKYRRLGYSNTLEDAPAMEKSELAPLAAILTGAGVHNVVWK